ncbi:exodeoxyribonuclease VII small subunit [Tepidibacillus marianensis]|uniref:exodeoxyribonuclease VII small subunit n=1 Tax=Tepidibacillus marianensis TaxID=3131995 RepID=UPI0030CC432B
MSHKLLSDEQIEALSFEQSLERLEEVVDQLESGHVPLEQAIDLFQEGMKLAKRCHIKLDNIEQKIEVLLEKDGEFLRKPFEQDEVE